jgi:hypothetical protein
MIGDFGAKPVKDPNKSFRTKAYNRLVKFAAEWQAEKTEDGQIFDRKVPAYCPIPEELTKKERRAFLAKRLDIREWLEFAFSDKNLHIYLQSKNLREIRGLRVKMAALVPMEELIKELLDEAAVHGVMLS